MHSDGQRVSVKVNDSASWRLAPAFATTSWPLAKLPASPPVRSIAVIVRSAFVGASETLAGGGLGGAPQVQRPARDASRCALPERLSLATRASTWPPATPPRNSHAATSNTGQTTRTHTARPYTSSDELEETAYCM